VVSPSLSNFDAEFHQAPGCCIFYYSGTVYYNYGGANGQTNASEGYSVGDIVTVRVDMDGKAISFLKAGQSLCNINFSGETRLKLACLLNGSSQVTLETSPY